jgi:hypothetical protein
MHLAIKSDFRYPKTVGIGLGNGMPGWQGEALLEKAD